MLTRIHTGASGVADDGDAIFSWTPTEDYPLHVGICIESDRPIDSDSVLLVRGLPDIKSGRFLGDDEWHRNAIYHPDIVASRGEVDSIRRKDVSLLSEMVVTEHSQLISPNGPSRCRWKAEMRLHQTKTIRDGIRLFLSGTCAQFVEYLYQAAGLDLVSQDVLFSPVNPKRLFPASQIHAFFQETYPLRYATWDVRLESYPACLY